MVTPWHLPTGHCSNWSAQRLVAELLVAALLDTAQAQVPIARL
jgi:hypothetical protein